MKISMKEISETSSLQTSIIYSALDKDILSDLTSQIDEDGL